MLVSSPSTRRTACVPEELTFEERLGDGTAVDRDERARCACGLLVEEARAPDLRRARAMSDSFGLKEFLFNLMTKASP